MTLFQFPERNVEPPDDKPACQCDLRAMSRQMEEYAECHGIEQVSHDPVHDIQEALKRAYSFTTLKCCEE